MRLRIVLCVLVAVRTLAAQKAPEDGDGPAPVPALESFSVASHEGQSWLIVDVQPVRPNGSKVRFIQVHRACGSARVHEVDHVFDNVSVQQLAKDVDLCASDETVAGIINSFKRKQIESGLYPEQGVEAQCGAERVTHFLPFPGDLRFAALQSRATRIAALWRLSEDIRKLYANETGQALPRDGHGENWRQPGL